MCEGVSSGFDRVHAFFSYQNTLNTIILNSLMKRLTLNYGFYGVCFTVSYISVIIRRIRCVRENRFFIMISRFFSPLSTIVKLAYESNTHRSRSFPSVVARQRCRDGRIYQAWPRLNQRLQTGDPRPLR